MVFLHYLRMTIYCLLLQAVLLGIQKKCIFSPNQNIVGKCNMQCGLGSFLSLYFPYCSELLEGKKIRNCCLNMTSHQIIKDIDKYTHM